MPPSTSWKQEFPNPNQESFIQFCNLKVTDVLCRWTGRNVKPFMFIPSHISFLSTLKKKKKKGTSSPVTTPPPRGDYQGTSMVYSTAPQFSPNPLNSISPIKNLWVENVLFRQYPLHSATPHFSKQGNKNMVIFRGCDLCKLSILPGIMVILETGPSGRAGEAQEVCLFYPVISTILKYLIRGSCCIFFDPSKSTTWLKKF